MPSIAVCPNADIPVDLLKNLVGFDDELKAIEYLVEKYLDQSHGRSDAAYRIAQVEEAVRKGKKECVIEHFGD